MHDLRTETGSRLGQLRGLEFELAALHGYRRAPHGNGLDCLDPITGERISLGAVIARLRREHREARERAEGARLFARQERGQGDDEAAEQVQRGHGAMVVPVAAAGEGSP